jgi:hypothetical protein
MNLIKLFTASLAILGALIASPAAQAHATYSIGDTAGGAVWLNGVAWAPPASANIPSLGYIGIHGGTASNKRVVETGYNNNITEINAAAAAAGVSATDYFGGVFAGITPVLGNTYLGQLNTFNGKPANASNQLSTTKSISVTENSWAGGVYDSSTDTFNTGLLYGNIHASTGTGNPEQNLMNMTTAGNEGLKYLNITVGDDNMFSGNNLLAFSVYQGFATGPGLSGMNFLGSVLASTIGQNIGLSILLTGNYINDPAAAGEYTIVVGDQGGANGSFDGHIKLGVEANATALYANQIAAVPVPGAVWLFGSAMAGFIGFGRRKQLAA